MNIDLEQAVGLINQKKAIAVPTETVYGLAALALSEEAILEIYRIKHRPPTNPLIVHVASFEEALDIGEFDEEALSIAKHFWPGPLTIVVKSRFNVAKAIHGGMETIAIRFPSHPIFLKLIQKTGPLAAPSANRSGLPSPTTRAHVESDLGKDFPVLDGGPTKFGIESTVIIRKENRWYFGREGAISREDLFPFIKEFKTLVSDTPLCPGQAFRHYAPKARLTTKDEKKVNAIVGFSNRTYPSHLKVYSLGDLAEPDKISVNLFSTLRQLDIDQIKEAVVDLDFTATGPLRAVKERLLKALEPSN